MLFRSGNIPEGTSEGLVSEPSSFQEAEPASGGNRESSQGKDGSDRRRIIGETSSPGQEGRPDGMDSLHERNSRNGGGSRSARSGVLLRGKIIENDLCKAGEEQASVLLLPDLPGIKC